MTLSLDHYRDFARDKGIKVQLIRRVYSGKTIISIGKNRYAKLLDLLLVSSSSSVW